MKSYPIYSPKNERKRKDKLTSLRLPARTCWHCGKEFHPTTKFERYCGQACRFWHLNIDDAGFAYQQESRNSCAGFLRYRDRSGLNKPCRSGWTA
jgi:hypothetical protein